MSGNPMALAPLGEGCICVSRHVPAAYVPVRHHIKPESWGGRATQANLITLCPSTHTAVHRLLDEYVRHGGDPGWETRRKFGPLAQDLALRGWNQRPTVPTITSLPHTRSTLTV